MSARRPSPTRRGFTRVRSPAGATPTSTSPRTRSETEPGLWFGAGGPVDAGAEGPGVRPRPPSGRIRRGSLDAQVAGASRLPLRGCRRFPGAAAAPGDGLGTGLLRARVVPGDLGPRRFGDYGGDGAGWWSPDERIVETAEGNGPVNALDAALRKAIGSSYPTLGHIHLIDYRVRVLDTNLGTGAVTRVLIDTTDGDVTWTTIGVSENIIEASWQALYESIVYGLLHSGARCTRIGPGGGEMTQTDVCAGTRS